MAAARCVPEANGWYSELAHTARPAEQGKRSGQKVGVAFEYVGGGRGGSSRQLRCLDTVLGGSSVSSIKSTRTKIRTQDETSM